MNPASRIVSMRRPKGRLKKMRIVKFLTSKTSTSDDFVMRRNRT